MDGGRFDAVARAMARGSGTRRAALLVMAGGAFVAIAARLGLTEVAARLGLSEVTRGSVAFMLILVVIVTGLATAPEERRSPRRSACFIRTGERRWSCGTSPSCAPRRRATCGRGRTIPQRTDRRGVIVPSRGSWPRRSQAGRGRAGAPRSSAGADSPAWRANCARISCVLRGPVRV
jgi:hypothetical protein